METITATYSIPACRLPSVQAALDKLNKRARRLKVTEITLKVVRAYTEQKHSPRDIHQTGPTHPVAYNDIEVTGVRPQLAGWEFAATLEHDAETGLTILRTSEAFKAAPIPKEFRKAQVVCDHCKLNRRRNDTFLCYNASAGFKQIGRNCLVDFLGGVDPHSYAAAAELWFDFSEFCESSDGGDEGWGGGGGGELITSIEEFVIRSFAVVRVRGFIGRVKAREINQAGGEACATADRVLNLIFPSVRDRQDKDWKEEDAATQPNDQDIARASAALAWVRGFDPAGDLNDYQHNLFVACASEFLTTRRAGIVASLPSAYLKHIDRQEELRKAREGKPVSNFVGKEGERLRDLVLTVGKIFASQGDFGTTYITKFTDAAGNAFTWFAHGIELREGETYLVTGTVKKHESHEKYGNSTILSRCDATEFYPEYLTGERFGVLVVVGLEVLRPCSNEKLTGFKKAKDAKAFAKKHSKGNSANFYTLTQIAPNVPEVATLGLTVVHTTPAAPEAQGEAPALKASPISATVDKSDDNLTPQEFYGNQPDAQTLQDFRDLCADQDRVAAI